MNRLRKIGAVLFGVGVLTLAAFAAPPEDFPRFQVPGHEAEMSSLRELFWLHYPGAGPKATMWDEWLPSASLWPAVSTENKMAVMRQSWEATLSARIMDNEGYVATHQHGSIAHQLGWPFPFWNQGRRGCGWHFSFKNTAKPPWRLDNLSKTNSWKLTGAQPGEINEDGWLMEVTKPAAVITAAPWKCDAFEVPFLQLRWQTKGLGSLKPFIEWTTPTATNFSAERRVYFKPEKARPGGNPVSYTMISMFQHPLWTNEIRQLRIGLGNTAPGSVNLQAFFSQYDTRHNINGQAFVRGCARYFWWTHDVDFLRANIGRMRTAIRYLMTEHQALKQKVIYTDWIGHDGRSGIRRTAGKTEILTGQGIGNNYWDLLPFGGQDCYATVQYYDALLTLAKIEGEIRTHPEWKMPADSVSFAPSILENHAAEVKATGNRLFWNSQSQRFNGCIDVDDVAHDYGFTFLNLEAVYYDFATPEHARAILAWINGDRLVAGDTAQGADIYHWRFAPRTTTKRNLDWYFWCWNKPESIPFGDQVQDGGAVLGFSYHDLMARLKVLGPDNTWQRLREIIRWFGEVQTAGGYREFYQGPRDGQLQGGGTAGGLGMDKEFFESVLVPQIMLYGFLGFTPQADGFKLDPHLPSDWPELTVDRIRFQELTFRIRVAREVIEIRKQGQGREPVFVLLPAGNWKETWLREDGSALREEVLPKRQSDGAVELNWKTATGVRFARN